MDYVCRMKIGVPKEIKSQENRVSMIPGCVAELVKRGHQVFVQRSAGIGASYGDEKYESVGATLCEDAGTEALNNVTHPWTMLIADRAVAGACQDRKELISGINTMDKQITCAPVANAHNLPYVDPQTLLL